MSFFKVLVAMPIMYGALSFQTYVRNLMVWLELPLFVSENVLWISAMQ